MKRRYQYVILFAVPAFLAALIISVMLLGVTAGVLWLFVFGDEAWPDVADNLMAAVFIIACVASWFSFLGLAYAVGKKQEASVTFNVKHLFAAVGATAMLVIISVSHQWRVGNIGAKSGSILCADYCRSRGYATSGTPAEDSGEDTCSCYGTQGDGNITVPMSEVEESQSQHGDT